MCLVLFHVSLKEFIFWGWWSMPLWIPLCYIVAMQLCSNPGVLYCSPVWRSAVDYHYQLLERQVHSEARCIQWPWFSRFNISCLWIIDVTLPHCVCYAMLIWTLMVLCSVSFGERPNLQDLSYRAKFLCGLDIGTLNGLNRAVNRWLLTWIVFGRSAGACGAANVIYRNKSQLGRCWWLSYN